jgi:hypothetical protein
MATLPFRPIAHRPTEVNALKQENPSKATFISDTAGHFVTETEYLQKPSN